ncbi:S8 family serine peptidase [Comamonas sp. JC664]|uniref:S8 family serine peptidase n=1 Tax=Comamonas sp. JC664 TaxID=2801917 RepID=UPI001749EF73|nr:S8 family serine peptidase [Comamonas sp. JC664]MBL0694971.1 S8 family serine peptidase [Comamonas sp. JC664]GHH02392.1 serine protease [Comamonas sp. KCTC 72670]
MKRYVWLGLVGGLVACGSDSNVEPQACPGTAGMDLPPATMASALQGEAAAPADGSEEVIITFRQRVFATAKANTDAFAEDVTRAGGQVKRRIPSLNMVSARVTPQMREALAQNPDVVSVSPDREVRALGMMQRPMSPQAWLGAEPRPPPNRQGSVGEYTEGLKMVKADKVWDANADGILDEGRPTGTGIKVCVVDSGWDNRHPELQAAFIGGKDFIHGAANALALDARVDSQGNVVVWGGGHGTHTAGTIAAQLAAGGKVRLGEDPNGVVGVAPTASLLVARVLNETGSGSTTNVIAALEWCQEQGANVVSLSLGAASSNTAEELAFNTARANGVLAIAATGNSGSAQVSYPAGYASVVGVGAVNFAGEWAAFSQYGEGTNLVGPGVGVLSSTIVGGAPYGEVDASGQQFASNPLEYSALGTYSGRLVDCGLGASVSDCGEGATCEGFLAYVDRGGGILFEEKVRNAIRAGAKAVIIGNHTAEEGAGNFTLNAPSERWVPTVSVSLESANILRGMMGTQVALDVSGLDYAIQSGTSMATPHVAGVAALVWSLNPQGLTSEQVRSALLETADDLGPSGWDPNYGSGLVNAERAVQRAESLLNPTPPAP